MGQCQSVDVEKPFRICGEGVDGIVCESGNYVIKMAKPDSNGYTVEEERNNIQNIIKSLPLNFLENYTLLEKSYNEKQFIGQNQCLRFKTCNGMTVEDWLSNNVKDPDTLSKFIRFLISEILTALAEFHKHGLYHYDLHLGNIFYCHEEKEHPFKIIDFGNLIYSKKNKNDSITDVNVFITDLIETVVFPKRDESLKYLITGLQDFLVKAETDNPAIELLNYYRSQLSGGSKSHTTRKIHILGRLRVLKKEGRKWMLTYKKKRISLSEARKIDRALATR
jgi:tRNA A-37 threonylcarbamoyl transferase component Bud32